MDLDRMINRYGTGSLKFDCAKEFGMPEDIMPLWVADMDFLSAPGIVEAIKKTAGSGLFGYTVSTKEYDRAVQGWYERHFGWKTDGEWIVKTPGVVFALAACVRAFTKPGDSVVIQQPVYYPFSSVVTQNGRAVSDNSLKLENGHYGMDLEDLERRLSDPKAKLMFLCSPHNPVGRVWTAKELCEVEELCLANDVILVSDEIHSDFVWGERRHHIAAGLDPRYEANTIVCTAPSKSFNLAGLQTSNIFIPDGDLRTRFRKAVEQTGLYDPNLIGLAACRAAYETGEEWLREVKEYIWENIVFTKEFIEKNIPEVTLIEPEGTYLLWLDFRGLGLSAKELNDRIINKGRVWLDAGELFGKEGEGFQRVNAACPRPYLAKALGKLAECLK